jgi:probable F420-dependent oxidoreductase
VEVQPGATKLVERLMEVGLALGSAASGPDAGPARIRELTLAAESLGLHSVWVPDHVVLPVGATSPFPYVGPGVAFEIERHGVTYDPMATLPYLAGLTHRVRLGVSVLVVPYRNPLVVAKWLASLDQLSGGRLLVGVGVGWLAEEFAALDQPRFTARGALSDEYLAIWQAAWTGCPTGFEGRYYRFGPLLSGPRPLQLPHPPIHVGGNSRAALQRVLRVGAGWHLTRLSPDGVAERVAALRQALTAAGRAADEILVSVRVTLDLRTDADTAGGFPGLLVGDADAVIAACRRYQSAGVGLLVPNLPASAPPDVQIRMLERLACDVIPALIRPAP